MNMQDATLLRAKDKRFDWPKMKKVFGLINEEVKIDKPKEISYVFNGLAPPSVKFIENFISREGFKDREMQEKLKLLPGAYYSPPNEHEFFRPGKGPDSMRKKKVMVYFIGGVTFAEISAIRFLNKLFPNLKFIVATTSIINGNKCIE